MLPTSNRLPPVEFSDCDDLVHHLDRAKNRWIDYVDGQRSKASNDWNVLVEHSVRQNTFRAFHGQTPSKSFHTWTVEHFRKEDFKKLIDQSDEISFDEAHSELVDSLIESWPDCINYGHAAINYGQAAKLTDLAVLAAYQSSQLDTTDLNKAARFIHVPLEEYVLLAIRNCAKTFPGPDAIRKIPPKPSMGFVRSHRQYMALQCGIRFLAKKADVPPLVLDFITWKESHPLSTATHI